VALGDTARVVENALKRYGSICWNKRIVYLEIPRPGSAHTIHMPGVDGFDIFYGEQKKCRCWYLVDNSKTTCQHPSAMQNTRTPLPLAA
jgi:hypothetical protein